MTHKIPQSSEPELNPEETIQMSQEVALWPKTPTDIDISGIMAVTNFDSFTELLWLYAHFSHTQAHRVKNENESLVLSNSTLKKSRDSWKNLFYEMKNMTSEKITDIEDEMDSFESDDEKLTPLLNKIEELELNNTDLMAHYMNHVDDLEEQYGAKIQNLNAEHEHELRQMEEDKNSAIESTISSVIEKQEQLIESMKHNFTEDLENAEAIIRSLRAKLYETQFDADSTSAAIDVAIGDKISSRRERDHRNFSFTKKIIIPLPTPPRSLPDLESKNTDYSTDDDSPVESHSDWEIDDPEVTGRHVGWRSFEKEEKPTGTDHQGKRIKEKGSNLVSVTKEEYMRNKLAEMGNEADQKLFIHKMMNETSEYEDDFSLDKDFEITLEEKMKNDIIINEVLEDINRGMFGLKRRKKKRKTISRHEND